MRMEDIEREENARIEQAEKRGKAEGLKQGLSQGRTEGQRELIKTLAQSMTIEQISKILQKTNEEIKCILKS